MLDLKMPRYIIFLVVLSTLSTIAVGCSNTEPVQQNETEITIETAANSMENADITISNSLENSNLQVIPASWSLNTKIATSIPVLDFADDNIVIMHDYFGLFIHNLNTGEIEDSINLQALGYDFYNDSSCKISVSQTGDIIWIWIASSELLYEYDRISEKLTIASDISQNNLFEGFVLTKDIPPEKQSVKSYRCSKKAILFADGSYGVLYIGNERITGISYIRDGEEWILFTKQYCTMPELIKQDDVFYEQFVHEGTKSADSLMFAYCTMINYGEYAGICVLSDGVAYSEELQKEWNTLQLTASSMEIRITDDKACFKVYINASGFSQNSSLLEGANEKYIYLKKKNDRWYVEGFLQDAIPDESWWI